MKSSFTLTVKIVKIGMSEKIYGFKKHLYRRFFNRLIDNLFVDHYSVYYPFYFTDFCDLSDHLFIWRHKRNDIYWLLYSWRNRRLSNFFYFLRRIPGFIWSYRRISIRLFGQQHLFMVNRKLLVKPASTFFWDFNTKLIPLLQLWNFLVFMDQHAKPHFFLLFPGLRAMCFSFRDLGSSQNQIRCPYWKTIKAFYLSMG